MTTIGGVVFRWLDRLPDVGDHVGMDGLVATVLEMDGHRLARVRIAKGTLDEEDEASEAEVEAQFEEVAAVEDRRQAAIGRGSEAGLRNGAQALGRFRGGLTTEIHRATDARG